ncbi:Uncharacterised protein [Salmonella enterica subsp. enterica]|uniref:Uncharacterized protein n=1 Tax=Salmonella enterica I TaxID=59201 RepID=A0A379WWY3_SALET|nr:Uncharacterised protein [Salmonella enterica subsp. enterica]
MLAMNLLRFKQQFQQCFSNNSVTCDSVQRGWRAIGLLQNMLFVFDMV